MPYIEAKISIELNNDEKNQLQIKLADVVSSAFSKPKSYIMTNIEDSKSLYMSGEKIENGAYIIVRALGAVQKQSCQLATKEICNMLANDYGLNGSNVYISYHSVDLWGWNGSMF